MKKNRERLESLARIKVALKETHKLMSTHAKTYNESIDSNDKLSQIVVETLLLEAGSADHTPCTVEESLAIIKEIMSILDI